MTDFFVWRGCRVSGAKNVLGLQAKHADAAQRATALLRAPTGLPANDDTTGLDLPVLDVLASSWTTPIVDTNSQITATTAYDYKLAPIHLKTGRTGKAIALPSVTIPAGYRAILRVQFNGPIQSDVGGFLIRDDVMVGPIWPLHTLVTANTSIAQGPPVPGSYINGSLDRFDLATGTAAIGDTLVYNGILVVVTSITGPTRQFMPTLTTPPTTAGAFTNITTGYATSPIIASPYAWQYIEDGRFTSRSGELGTTGSGLRSALDSILYKSNYQEGVSGFVRRLRGLSASTPMTAARRATVYSGGRLAKPTGKNRVYAINKIASEAAVDVAAVRDLRTTIGSTEDIRTTFAKKSEGVVVAIYQTKTTTVAAPACPPGQPASTRTDSVFVTYASKTRKLGNAETAVVTWFDSNLRQSAAGINLLKAYGLTAEEAASAAGLTPSSRVTSVLDMAGDVETAEAYDELSAEFTDDQVEEILDDDNILVIDIGVITGGQLKLIVADRDQAGTVPRNINGVTLVDITASTSYTAALVLSTATSFLPCTASLDLDQATADALAPVLAILESLGSSAIEVGLAMIDDLTDGEFTAVLESFTVIQNAVNSSPLGRAIIQCLMGQTLSIDGLDLLDAVNPYLDQLDSMLDQRFALRANTLAIVIGMICALVDLIRSYSPDFPADAMSTLDCLFVDSGILPPEITALLSCNLEIVVGLDLLMQAAVAELRELLALLSILGIYVGLRAGDNAPCSGPEVNALRNQTAASFGLPLL